MNFTQKIDNSYMIPTSVAVGSGEATDIRCVCDTVEDFKAFLDTTGMDLRYEGLVTYEKNNKTLKVYVGDDVWQVVGDIAGENNDRVDVSEFITLTQLSQKLESYYTKNQVNNKISEEIGKALLGGGETSPCLSSYVIDLDLYGIKEGLPSKPYTLEDYTMANNNIIGINRALKYAHDNGFTKVVLPRGSYSICYPNPIETQANLEIDFNFSTLKVMYDSVNRSPFDLGDKPVWQFHGNSILCSTPNTKITNLTLIGDRIDREWADPDEVLAEHTNGIKLGSKADFCEITNCNISYYMGDAIALYYSPYEAMFDLTNKVEVGGIDENGNNSSVENGVRTLSLDIPSDTSSFCIIGLGYAPTTSIPSRTYNAHFYDSNNTHICTKVNLRTRDKVVIPKNATKIKFSWIGNGTVDDGCMPDNPPYWILPIKHGIPDNVLVKNNEIHRCHRGGIFLGSNNTTIENNYFHDTGAPDGKDIDGLPTFPDGTRYAINTEDNVGHNAKIINNVFENTRLAIAIRGEHFEVSGNEFRHCGAGLWLYHLQNCIIDNNYFYHSDIGNHEFENFDRNWMLTRNTFVGSGVNFTGSGHLSIINDNLFKLNSSFSGSLEVLEFNSNVFTDSSCICSKTNPFNCTFKKSMVTASVSIDKFLNNCCLIDSVVNVPSNSHLYGVAFCDSYVDYGAVKKELIKFDNCYIKNKNVSIIANKKMLDVGEVSSNCEFVNCNIDIANVPIITSMGWGEIRLVNNIISANSSKGLLLDGHGSFNKFYIKDNIIKGLNSNIDLKDVKGSYLIDNLIDVPVLNKASDVKESDNYTFVRMPDFLNLLSRVDALESNKGPQVNVSSITLDKAEQSLIIGEKVQLNYTILPVYATNKGVTWKSSNPGVATVSNGLVTAISNGDSIITCTTDDGGKEATCKVLVGGEIPDDFDYILEASQVSNVVDTGTKYNYTSPYSIVINASEISENTVLVSSSNCFALGVLNGELVISTFDFDTGNLLTNLGDYIENKDYKVSITRKGDGNIVTIKFDNGEHVSTFERKLLQGSDLPVKLGESSYLGGDFVTGNNFFVNTVKLYQDRDILI